MYFRVNNSLGHYKSVQKKLFKEYGEVKITWPQIKCV